MNFGDLGLRPYVDDLKPFLTKLLGFIWQMVRDPVLGRGIGLVNVDALHGTSKCLLLLALRGTADGVVEDEDTDSSSPTEVSVICLAFGDDH